MTCVQHNLLRCFQNRRRLVLFANPVLVGVVAVAAAATVVLVYFVV